MKKILLTVILSVISTALLISSVLKFYSSEDENLYIAVAGPAGGSGSEESFGKSMAEGVQLYIDKVNAGGGIAGKKINILLFNDKNQEKEAMEAASEIAEDSRILLVLGHGSSPASIAAGKIYKKNGVPALTASADAKRITQENEWYFRLLSDNGFQGKFIAHYAYNVLKKTSAAIVYETDEWGTVFAENFETAARDLGMEIKKKWAVNSEKEDVNKDLSKITGELRAMDDPGLIFLAVRADEGVKIISAVKYPGAKYIIMGSSSFTTDFLIRKLKTYPLEQAIPGYYSDDIHAVSPFLLDTADEEAYRFRDDFVKKYGKEPSWVAARYYDAAKVVAEAIKKSDIRIGGPVQNNRKEVRAALESINNPEMAVKGVCGTIYFDKNRDDTGTGLSVGMYKNQRFVPAFFQYQASDPGQKETSEYLIQIEGRVLHKTSMVYTGIKVNEISNLNIGQSGFAADFYVWFRYKDEFDDMSDIRFANEAHPISLGYPATSRTTADGISIRTYHVKADFRSSSDFHRFPFDRQTLYIRFRHAGLERKHLIYVPDMSSQASLTDDERGEVSLNPQSGWKINGTEYRQDIFSDTSAQFLGSDSFTPYSQFNAEIHIERQGICTAVGTFLPLIVLLINLCLIYFMPPEQQNLRITVIIAVLMITLFCHQKLRAEVSAGYMILTDYAFFTLYGLVLMSALVSLLLFLFQKQGNALKTKQILRAGKILYIAGTATGVLLMYLY
jgi:branched-chain amino acid transport system substrate-binding protein